MNQSCYSTTDLNLAAYLIVHPGIKFKGLETVHGKTKRFLFSPQSRCLKLAAAYMSGSAQMNVRRFVDGLKMAKDVLFGSEREELILK